MCDDNYDLYWWQIAPYAEAGDNTRKDIIKVEKEENATNIVEGLLMNALHAIFLVLLL